MSNSTVQICLKNTFLNIRDMSTPTFRRAHTLAVVCGKDSPRVSVVSTTCSPGALSSWSLLSSEASGSDCGSTERTRVLDNYVASVGECAKTTVMIRSIPKNYDQEMLLAEVEETGLSVNFLYLPPGKTKSNRSYGFVNFETEFAAAEFLRRFEGHEWRHGALKQACVGYATLQGFQQNIAFFSKQEVAKGVAKRSPWVKFY